MALPKLSKLELIVVEALWTKRPCSVRGRFTRLFRHGTDQRTARTASARGWGIVHSFTPDVAGNVAATLNYPQTGPSLFVKIQTPGVGRVAHFRSGFVLGNGNNRAVAG
jgi:hypothetical protein